jgi:hypothetical protein
MMFTASLRNYLKQDCWNEFFRLSLFLLENSHREHRGHRVFCFLAAYHDSYDLMRFNVEYRRTAGAIISSADYFYSSGNFFFPQFRL